MKWILFVLPLVLSVSLEVNAHTNTRAHLTTHAHATSKSANAVTSAAKAKLDSMRQTQYLIVSSPGEMKICYSKIVPGSSNAAVIKPLVDSALVTPMGIAVDRSRGRLFVADPDQSKIFSYTVVITPGGDLVSDQKQIAIAEGVAAHWLAVDQAGNLYYTEQTVGAVMMITLEVLERIYGGEITSADLKTETEAEVAATEQAAANAAAEAVGEATPAPEPAPVKISLYVGGADGTSAVSGPAGIAADGMTLYWGNEQGGTTHGSVVAGARDLEMAPAGSTGGVRIVSQNTNTVFGVVASSNGIFYSDSTQFVYGVKKAGGTPEPMADALQQPRGLAWDGDGTVYVADTAGNMIYSFPSGRLERTHLSRVVQLHGAYGLAILSEGDSFNVPASAAGMAIALIAFLREL